MSNSTTAAPLSNEQLDRLEALAKAATPGPWKAKQNDVFAGARYRICQGVTAGGSAKGMIDEQQWRLANARFIAELNPATALALIAQARAARPAQPKREIPPEMKAAIEEAHKTGATGALLPDGSAIFINYGHDYGDNDHLCCTACGGSGHIEDQQVRAAQAHHAAATTGEDARLKAAIIAACENCETEMEGYAYFGSNPGVPKDRYDDVADEVIAAMSAPNAIQKEGE